jgi:Mor transcription activator family
MNHPLLERDSLSSTPSSKILEILGTDLGEKLLTHFAGKILYVPRRVILDHPIVNVVGLEAAKIFQEEFGGQQISFPRKTCLKRAERNLSIWKQRQAGATIQVLAKDFDLSIRQVCVILNKMKTALPSNETFCY